MKYEREPNWIGPLDPPPDLRCNNMASSTKPRQPRLRASCDGCFLAKVKCSKSRPICSRCLACGILCHYSPSSRSGKPKPDSNHSSHSNAPHDQQMRSLMEDKAMAFVPQAAHDNTTYPLQTGWPTPPTSGVEDSMSRNPSMTSGFHLLGMHENTMNEQDLMSAPQELYSSIPWAHSTDIACTTFPDMSVPATHMQGPHARSQSFDAAMPIPMPMSMPMPISMPMTMPMAWRDPTPHDVVSYSQVQTPTSISSNYFPSPTTTPIIQPTLSYQQSSGHCTCVAACLQSLMSLHNISVHTQPFDVVLQVNQKAMDACSAMLACTTCLSKPGVETVTMLLATAIGKIAFVYRSAAHMYNESCNMSMLDGPMGGGMGNVSLGTYQLSGGGKWTKMDVLDRELRKLEDLFTRFREVCKDVFVQDPDMIKAVISYTGQNIGSTTGGIDHREIDSKFVVA
ncbi:hypothetical protein F4823DRAFT_582380 [Ustulina deusta]|nr:hypothetical protein F4823DRAFT_582380 [Ustulina deusta]